MSRNDVKKYSPRPGGFGLGLCCALACAIGSAQAAPAGGEVTRGQGSIRQSGSHTDVFQDSSRLTVDWRSFNLGSDESVRFHQPDSSSAVLNRILDSNPSHILGRIDANGRVFLMNPYGIVFGPGSRVNVNALVASSLSIDADDFMRGNYRFSAADGEAGAVINRGLLQAATGGSISLLGGAVSNEGLIVANLGQVNLAAGGSAVLDFDGDGLMYFEVDGELLRNATNLSSAVANSGEIRADGGQVLLQARSARGVFDNLVNNDGIIQATGIEHSNGQIRLVAEGGDIRNSGDLSVASTYQDGGSIVLESDATTFVSGNAFIDAGSSIGQGGDIHILGEQVGLFDQAHLNASGMFGGGEILIGGDFQGSNAVVPNALRTYVGNEVSINTDALQLGDGGRVIVWSDETTRYSGDISARGGISGGDGGFVEVSGKQGLRFAGYVDTRAPQGRTGTLLLDPTNIAISADGGHALSDVDAFADTTNCTTACDINPSTINNAASNVILQATQDITFDSAINITGPGISLTAQAGRDIDVNASITTNGGAVHLEADSPHSGAVEDGEVTFDTGGAISSNGGVITLIGADLLLDNAANDSIDAGSGGINIARSVNSTGDSIQLNINTGANQLRLSQEELDSLSTTGSLVIGAATTAGPNGLHTGGTSLVAETLAVSSGVTIDSNTANSISLVANNGITLSQDLTTSREVIINADVNAGDDTGTFTIDAGHALNSGGNNIQITANNVAINGTINAGGADVSLTDSDGSGIGLGNTSGGLDLSSAELQNITAGSLQLESAGSIEVEGISATHSGNIAGATTLISAADISFTGADSIFANALAVNADDGIAVGVNLTTNSGNLTLDGDTDGLVDTADDVAIAAGVTLDAAGSLSLAAANGDINAAGVSTLNGNGVTLSNDYTAAGSVSIDAGAGALVLAGGMSLSTSNDAIGITAADVDLQGTANSGSAAVTITASGNGNIGLGTGAGDLVLSDAELGNITANGLNIQTTGAGIIDVAGTVAGTMGGFGNLVLDGAGGITLDAAGNTFENSVSLTGATILAGDLSSVNGDLDFNSAVSVTGDAVVSVAGALSFGGTITGGAGIDLDLTGDTVTVNAAVSNLESFDAVGTTSVAVAAVTTEGAQSYTGATTLNGNITSSAGAIDFANAVTVAGANTIVTADTALTFNSTIDGAMGTEDLSLDGDTIVISGAVGAMINLADFDASGATSISVGAVTTAGAQTYTGTTTLNGDISAAGVTFNGAVTVASDLAVDAGGSGSVSINSTLSGNSGAEDLNLAGAAVTALGTLSNLATLDVTAVNSISLNAVDTAGAQNHSAGANITLNGALTAGGAMTLIADSNNNGLGTLTVSATGSIDTANNALDITAADIALTGALNSGAATTTIAASNNRSIGLGAAAGGLTLGGGELQNITAGSLALQSGGNIQVSGVSAAHSGNIAGTTTLSSDSAISFTGAASTFTNGLAANADGGMSVNVNLTTNNGALALDGDADNAIGGGLTLAGGVSLTAAGDLSVAATSSGITAAGVSNLSGNGITISDAYDSTAGDLTINAGNGIFTNNGTITATGRNVDITADAVDIGANIDTTAAVTILGSTAGRQIDLGTDTAGSLSLTGTELGRIVNAGTLVIGDSAAGNISITNNVGTGAGVSDLTLRSGGTITDNGAAVLTANTLNLASNGAIGSGVDGVLDTSITTLNVTGTGGNGVDIRENNGLALGAVNAGGGDIGITLSSGSLTSASSLVTARNLDLNLLASAAAIGAGGNFINTDLGSTGMLTASTNNGDIFLSEANGLNTGLINAGTGNVSLTAVQGNIIDSATISANSLTLATNQANAAVGSSGNAIDTSLGAGTLAVSTNNGDVFISEDDGLDLATITAGTGNVFLTAVAGNIGGSGAISANNLTLTTIAAGGAIGGSGDALDADLGAVGVLTATTSNGGIFVAGNNTLTLSGINAGTGDVEVTVLGAGNLTNAGAVTGTSVTLTADNMALGGTINAGSGAGTVTLQTRTDGQAISLGNSGGGLQLNDAELDTITADTLRIGDATNAGAITLTNAISPASVNVLSLITDEGISQNAGAGIGVGQLRIDAGTAVGLTAANNDVDTLAAAVSDANQGFSFTDADSLGIGSVDGAVGINTGNGNISLVANGLNFAQQIDAGSANFSFNTANGSMVIGVGDSGQAVNFSQSNLTTDINAGSVTLGSTGRGGSINVGTTDALNIGALNLNLLTDGDINIGNNHLTTTGDLVLSAAAGAGTAGAITSGGGQLNADNLTLNGGGGISANLNNVNAVAASNTNSGDIVLSTAGDITLGTASGSINQFNNGRVEVNSGGDITVSGAGIIIGGAGSSLQLAGADFNIDAAVSAGTIDIDADGAVGINAGVSAQNLIDIQATAITNTTLGALNSAGGLNLHTTFDSIGTGLGSGNAINVSVAGNIAAETDAAGGGDIFLRSGGDMLLQSLETDSGSTQTVSFELAGGADANFIIGGTFDTGNDNLVLNMNTGTAQFNRDLAIDSLTINGGGGVSFNSGDITTAASLGINSNGVVQQTGGVLDIGGTTSLNAADTIVLNNAANDFGGTVTLLGGATVTLRDQNSLTLALGAPTAVSGDLTLTAGTTLTLNNAVDVSGDVLTLTGDSLNTAGAITAGNINFQADAMTIGAGVTSNTAILATRTGGRQIFVGTATGTGLVIDDNTLNQFSANDITIGNSTSGNITVADVDVGTRTLSLISDGSIRDSGSQGITAGTLNLAAGADIGGNGGLNTAITTLFADAGGNNGINVINSGDLNIASVATGGSVTLESTNGALNESDPEDGATDISAGTINLNAADGIGNLRVMELSGTVNATNAGANGITMVGSEAIYNNLNAGSGAIHVSGSGAMTQSGVFQSNGGSITLQTTAGGIVMQRGAQANSNGGDIHYQSIGAIELGVLDAGGQGGGDITVNTRNAPILNNGDGDSLANVANLAGNNIHFDLTGPTPSAPIGNEATRNFIVLDANEFNVLTLENAASVALDLTSGSGSATIESLQEQGRIVTTASVFDASQARAGGAQQAQAANLEGLGFIDTALFNQSFDLFVIDGPGIRLPEDEEEAAVPPETASVQPQ